MLIDSHCHLDRLDLSHCDNDLSVPLAEAREQGVDNFLCISTDLARVESMLALIAEHEDVYATVGVHPLSKEIGHFDYATLLAKIDQPRVIAIGETGLDYHYQSGTAEAQQEAFTLHLRASAATGKPVIIHTREAREDTLQLIDRHGDINVGGVLHCFTESWDMARRALDLNYYISFSGIVTFRSADELREVVKQVPLERMLVETDSPWLAPVPYRGKSNEPKYVKQVAEAIADIKGVPFAEVAEVTSDNFRKLFKV